MLLTEKEIAKAYNETNAYLDDPHTSIAKAQLKKVGGEIGKVLVKYSVIDGKLSCYVDGTVPLWALPNVDWQALLGEIS